MSTILGTLYFLVAFFIVWPICMFVAGIFSTKGYGAPAIDYEDKGDVAIGGMFFLMASILWLPILILTVPFILLWFIGCKITQLGYNVGANYDKFIAKFLEKI